MTRIRSQISLIVPVHNASGYLEQTLHAIRGSSYTDFELVVVDDGSSDSSKEVAQHYADMVVTTGKKSGPAVARNLGARVSSGVLLCFLDADVKLHPDTLLKMVNSLREAPEYAAVFGSYDTEPLHTNFFSQYKNLFHHYIHQNANTESSTFWAGCGLIRREDFEAVGGFSSKYNSPSIEDVELGYKLVESGKRIKLDKNIQVTHLKKWTFAGLMKADILYRAIPWSALAVRRGLPYDLNFKVVDRLSAFIILLLIGSLLSMCFWKPAALFVLGSSVALVFFHWKLYRFFWRVNGLGFALLSLLFHWFYYFYSTITFIGSTVFFRFQRFARNCWIKADAS
jgi:glycosyltransferase involved in cell wall biosynthesis